MTGPGADGAAAADAAVRRAVAEVAAGRVVVVVDDHDREDEGDLVMAAEHATAEALAFIVRHTSGVVCVPMEGEALDRLGLPPMVSDNQDRHRTDYAVTTDAATGVGTGISAADRARTITLLADPATTAGDLRRPGHVFPLRAADGGVLVRRGHTEAAVDLARLAGLQPAGVIAEVVADDGSMARLPQLQEFARRHRLAMVSIAQLADHLRRTRGPVQPVERRVARTAATRLPTRHGELRAVGYRSRHDGSEPVALVAGDLGDGEGVLVRLHSECVTGDALGSLRCDCGAQLEAALGAVTAQGRGVVLYLRGQEGRGIGLSEKLRAYALQDAGADTVEANLALGHPVDARDYRTAADVLHDLGVRSVRLLTNNPAKETGLEQHGIVVLERVPVPVPVTADNVRYLRTKRDRMGHDLGELADDADLPAGAGR